jgi:hypothetical protein
MGRRWKATIPNITTATVSIETVTGRRTLNSTLRIGSV